MQQNATGIDGACPMPASTMSRSRRDWIRPGIVGALGVTSPAKVPGRAGSARGRQGGHDAPCCRRRGGRVEAGAAPHPSTNCRATSRA
jgi:hypothetical protein